MKKKVLLMVALCTATLTLVACGSKETNTGATSTEAPAPTQSVMDNATDATVTEAPTVTEPTATETPAVTEPTTTEAPVVTEPTVAPVEPETEVPTPTPTEAPTPTPTPTEAPKELSKGEQMAKQYAENYPFMEYEIFENVTINGPVVRNGNIVNDIYTSYVCYFKNNSDKLYHRGAGVIKPGAGYYIGVAPDIAEAEINSYDDAVYTILKYFGDVYPVTDMNTIETYLCEQKLQVCEDENCLFTSYDENITVNENDSYSIHFFNADDKLVYRWIIGDRDKTNIAKNVNNQIHIDISSIGDVDWTTAKIVYNANE